MKKIIYVFALIIAVGFTACNNELDVPAPPIGNENEVDVEQYNADLREFALAVSGAMQQSVEFRNIIKETNLVAFDGDFNTLLRHLIQPEILIEQDSAVVEVVLRRNMLRSGGGCSSGYIRNLLESHYQNTGANNLLSTRSAGSGSILDYLQAKYPLLQIAIPVNIEKWNPESEIPVVTFIPYNDRDIEYLIGWDANGNEVRLCAKTPPDFPVIVIGQNERVNKGLFCMCFQPPCTCLSIPPPLSLSPPTNLVGQTVPSGIHLSWQIPADMPSTNFMSGYEVWAKRPGQMGFERIAILHGRNNTTFLDNAFYEAGHIIDYKVLAFFHSHTPMGLTRTLSDFSNVVTLTTPARPEPVLSFTAQQTGLNQTLLEWTTNPAQAVNRVILTRFVDGFDNDFRQIGTANSNTFHLVDGNVPPGRRIRYRAQIEGPTGNLSSPARDFIYSTYRDPSRPSAVHIRRIEHNGTVESWWRGSPEFVLTVLMVNRAGGHNTPIIVQSNIRLNFPARFLGIGNTRRADFNVPILTHWMPGFFYDMLTFQMIESDNRFSESHFDIQARINVKNPETERLDTSLTSTTRVTFNSKGSNVGSAHYSYFQPTEHWVVFPNYGVRMLVNIE